MSFYHKKKLKGLIPFYKSMKAQGIDVGTFEHVYNKVDSHVILDTTKPEWQMVFIKDVVGETLIIPIQRGFVFVIDGNEAYRNFIDYFDISGVAGAFHISDFTRNLNDQIPNEYFLNNNRRETVNNYTHYERNEPGIYPIGTINWQFQHVLHPEWEKDKYHRSEENLNKTKQLYPNIYEATKDLDITIRYGRQPGENTQNMLENKYDWDQ